jgi:hypothetical protein
LASTTSSNILERIRVNANSSYIVNKKIRKDLSAQTARIPSLVS